LSENLNSFSEQLFELMSSPTEQARYEESVPKMIEDRELRNLFKIESEEQLQRLDRGLLDLEKNPENQALLEEMFREIHSLKGGARMLLLPEMEEIAHRFESALGAAKKGALRLTSDILDNLYFALESLRKLAREAVTGEPAGVSAADVIARLTPPEKREKREAAAAVAEPRPSQPVEAQAPSAVDEHAIEAARDEPRTRVRVEEAPPVSLQPSGTFQESEDAGSFRIDTIRVATEKLDALMTLLGELSVTKNRLAHRLVMIEEALDSWEKLNNLSAGYHSMLTENGVNLLNGSAKKLLEHQRQEKEQVERLGASLGAVKLAVNEDSSKLDLIVGDLEDGVRSIRLLPLSTVFDLFPRMVRDLGRSQGKEVQLATRGGETTADKRVIEDIKDPLMHMIRNSIDHGIEPPEETDLRIEIHPPWPPYQGGKRASEPGFKVPLLRGI
jgi:two-component system, chemotaxis family, sensor kinase CheA